MTRINFFQNVLTNDTDTSDYCTGRGTIGLCGNFWARFALPISDLVAFGHDNALDTLHEVQVRARLAEELSNFSEGLKGPFRICKKIIGNAEHPPPRNFHENTLEETACSVLSSIYRLHSKRALYHMHCVCLNVCYSTQVHLLDVLLS